MNIVFFYGFQCIFSIYNKYFCLDFEFSLVRSSIDKSELTDLFWFCWIMYVFSNNFNSFLFQSHWYLNVFLNVFYFTTILFINISPLFLIFIKFYFLKTIKMRVSEPITAASVVKSIYTKLIKRKRFFAGVCFSFQLPKNTYLS